MEPDISQPASQQTKSNPFIIPAAIVIGFGMIAAALFFSRQDTAPLTQGTGLDSQKQIPTTPETQDITPVTEDDHILGNPNAPIMIVEYSDFDCPFCKSFHETMTKVMDEYGKSGKVAWVYRHFPIEQLHPNAPAIALASECVADLEGNDAFWRFTNTIFDSRATNELTNMVKIESYAQSAGVDADAFTTCMSEATLTQKVIEDFQDGANAGVGGTPYSFVLIGGQEITTINGAQPYEAVRQIVDALITKIDGLPEVQ